MPTTSYCAGCNKVQPLLRAYWWEMLGAWCGTCQVCHTDLVIRADPAVLACVARMPDSAFALVPV